MTVLPPTSRFQIVERPYSHPGKCVVCGATDRPVIDWNMDLDDFGTIYMCLECGAELARALGFVSPDEVEAIRLEAGQSITDYLAQTEQKVISNELYHALSDCVDRFVTFVASGNVHLNASPVDAGGSEDGSDATPVRPDDEAAGEDSGQGDKPARGRRSASVPANPGDELGLLNL